MPLLAFTFLTPLNEFLHQANCEPKFVLCLLGRTGTRKSTLAALFLSFFGRFNSSDCRTCLYDLAKKQSVNIDQDKLTHKFIQKLYSLIESGQAVLLDKNNPVEFKPVNYIGYQDDEFFYLNADIAHKQVKRLCGEQEEAFSISKNGLIKALAEEVLTVCDKGKNTKSIRIGDKTLRFICLIKDKVDAVAELCE